MQQTGVNPRCVSDFDLPTEKKMEKTMNRSLHDYIEHLERDMPSRVIRVKKEVPLSLRSRPNERK
jgi:hypothetical protein